MKTLNDVPQTADDSDVKLAVYVADLLRGLCASMGLVIFLLGLALARYEASIAGAILLSTGSVLYAWKAREESENVH